MAIERWISVASLGLFIMFVGEIVSIFHYMMNPIQEIEPGSQILEFISISIVPALILAGSSFLMSRRYGSRLVGSMIVAGGAVTLGGMYYANTLLSQIATSYLITEVTITPPLFMAVSVPTMIIGCILFRIKPKPKKDYFFDR